MIGLELLVVGAALRGYFEFSGPLELIGNPLCAYYGLRQASISPDLRNLNVVVRLAPPLGSERALDAIAVASAAKWVERSPGVRSLVPDNTKENDWRLTRKEAIARGLSELRPAVLSIGSIAQEQGAPPATPTGEAYQAWMNALCIEAGSWLAKSTDADMWAKLKPFESAVFSDRPTPAERPFSHEQGRHVALIRSAWAEANRLMSSGGREMALSRVAFSIGRADRGCSYSLRLYDNEGNVVGASGSGFALSPQPERDSTEEPVSKETSGQYKVYSANLIDSLLRWGASAGGTADDPRLVPVSRLRDQLPGASSFVCVTPDRLVNNLARPGRDLDWHALASTFRRNGVRLSFDNGLLTGCYDDPYVSVSDACLPVDALRQYSRNLGIVGHDPVRRYSLLCRQAGPSVRTSKLDDGLRDLIQLTTPGYPSLTLSFRMGFVIGGLNDAEYGALLDGRTVEIHDELSNQQAVNWVRNEFECLEFAEGTAPKDVDKVGTFTFGTRTAKADAIQVVSGHAFLVRGNGMPPNGRMTLDELAGLAGGQVAEPTVGAFEQYIATAKALVVTPPFQLFQRRSGLFRLHVGLGAFVTQDQDLGGESVLGTDLLPSGFPTEAQRRLISSLLKWKRDY